MKEEQREMLMALAELRGTLRRAVGRVAELEARLEALIPEPSEEEVAISEAERCAEEQRKEFLDDIDDFWAERLEYTGSPSQQVMYAEMYEAFLKFAQRSSDEIGLDQFNELFGAFARRRSSPRLTIGGVHFHGCVRLKEIPPRRGRPPKRRRKKR